MATLNDPNDNFESLQSHLMGLVDDTSFSSKTIVQHLNHEENLIKQCADQNPMTQGSLALAAQTCGVIDLTNKDSSSDDEEL